MNSNDEMIITTLLEWGKIRLTNPSMKEQLNDVQHAYSALSSVVDVALILSEKLSKMKREIQTAEATLSSVGLIDCSEGEASWFEGQHALYVFDSVIYLDEAVRSIVAIDDATKINILAELNGMIRNIYSWVYEGSISLLRLTPLNNIRKNFIAVIPEENRYLFPWHEIYSDYPNATLELLVRNNVNEDAKNDIADNLSEKIRFNLAIIRNELENDVALDRALKERQAVHLAMSKYASEHNVNRLLWLSDNWAEKYTISRYPALQHAYESGLVRSALTVLESAKELSSVLALELRFLAAFCGPGLTESQRLEILEKVEKESDGSIITIEKSPVLSGFQRWLNNDQGYSDDWLLNKAFTQWMTMLDAAALRLKPHTNDLPASDFWNKLVTIRGTVFPVGWVEMLRDKIRDRFNPSHLWLAPELGAARDAADEEDSKVIYSIKRQLVGHSVNILSRPDELDATGASLRLLYGYYNRKLFHCCGFSIDDNGNPIQEGAITTERYLPLNITISNIDSPILLVLLSKNETAILQASKTVKDILSGVQPSEKVSDVVCIFVEIERPT